MRANDGLLVLGGYGLRVVVDRGHLVCEDGIGSDRRQYRYGRVDRSLRRVVIIGHHGSLSLDAVRWLHAVGVPLVQLGADGDVLLVASPTGAMLPNVRRAQALASETGLGMRLAIELIQEKAAGQATLLDRLGAPQRTKVSMARAQRALYCATTARELMRLESDAARLYWGSWTEVEVRFAKGDAAKIPEHWKRFGTRVSVLTGSTTGRKAVNPANAILNYLYAIVEAEARIAALAAGLDPLLGLLHVDKPSRSALALDLMEPVRPAVEAFVLDLLGRRELTRQDVFERLDGQCRLLPPLTTDLVRSAPRWAALLRPLAQDLTKALEASMPPSRSKPAAVRRKMDPVVRSLASRKPSAGIRFQSEIPAESVQPGPRQGIRGKREVVRAHVAMLSMEADDPRRSLDAGAKRRESMRRVRQSDLAWRGATPDPSTFRKTILPRIQGVPLVELMAATGLTHSACSRMRNGKSVPHPRHWDALARLTQ